VLWSELFNTFKIKIHFAHRTFKWNNEAKGKAAVHVVIIGFANFDINEKIIYDYDDINSEPHAIPAKAINPYLVDAKELFIKARNLPLINVSKMVYGNKPTDGGFFLFTDDEKNDFLKSEVAAEKYIKPFISAHEFLNGKKRWCLWLKDARPSDLKSMPKVMERIEGVRRSRLESKKAATRKLAEFPTQFEYVSQPDSDYILVPLHTSENRKYIPFGFFNSSHIAANSCSLIPKASLYEFGIISSFVHMVWVKTVCGRIKSDYRYSGTIVYNNYPWPENPTDKQKQAVEEAAQAVLDARAVFPESSLADLYDPNTMPPALVKAHQQLDKAVDLCYRPQPFPNETKRIEFLFELYDRYTAGLFIKEKKSKKKKL
ncbi:MAG TPA: type IIL restriction-modification enzyme MmeI, partial [Chitinophagaceae bacterium]|nr:type IIL restriction-modification enzyme MmeI [Chitinophagaceae bacterium]